MQSWPLLLLVLAIGIGLSLAAFRFGVGWERNKLQHAFIATARHMELRLARELEINANIVRSLHAYFESEQEQITPKEFQVYARGIMRRQKEIQALEWIPRIAASQRAAFEDAGKRMIGPDFQITERSASGQMVRAGQREEYFPVYYIEPMTDNRPALGFDLASDPTRLAALNQVAESGRVVVSGRITLVQETGQAYGFLFFCPVFANAVDSATQTNRRDHLRGFASGAFRIPNIVRKVDPDSRESGINVFVFDTTENKAKPTLLYGNCPDNPNLAEQPDVACLLKAAGTDLNYQADLAVGGRIWSLLLVATPGYLQSRVTLLPHTVLAIGLLATLLSVLFVLKNAKASKELFDKNQALNTEIDERRNAEARLRQSEEMYRLLFDQSESLISVYDVHGYCLMMNQKLAKLFGGLPEQFIGKKFAELHPEIGEEYTARIAQVIASAETRSYEDLVIFPKGKRVLLSDVYPVRDTQGIIYAAQIMSNDITESKKAQTALQESELKFRSITENAVDLIFIKDKARRYTFVNRSAKKLMGLPEEEILGKTPEEIFGPEQGRIITDVDDRGFAGETVNKTRRLVINGKQYFFNTIQTPLEVEDGEVTSIMGIVRDVTEFKQTEEALKSSQALLKNVFDASPALIALTSVEDGRYLDANNAFFIAIGYSRQDVLGKTSIDLGMWSAPEDRDEPKELLLKDGFLQDYEVRFRMKNGEVRDFLWNAVTIVVEGELCSANVMVDITGRLYAERAIKENEEALSRQLAEIEHLYETSPLGLALLDKDLRFVRINQTLADLNGAPIQEHIGRTIGQVTPKTASFMEPLYRRVVKTGEPVTNLTLQGDTSLGLADKKDWLINFYPVKADDGSLLGVETVVQDITEIKEAQRILTRINEELEARVAQRTGELAAAAKELKAFAYSVSHDLRAPLRALDGFSQALLQDYLPVLDPEGQDYLNRIRAASQRMGLLIDDMLKLSRVTRVDFTNEPVDLSRMAAGITNRLKKESPQREAEFVIQPGLQTLGDKNLLRILMENLLGNAWKFTAKQPAAEIEFGARQQAEGAEKVHGPALVFYIKDNGVGFDPKYMDKLFQPFQRLHSNQEFPGTGIGLATIQRIVNRHGGKIWAESQVGSGATFFFILGR